ncbi:G-protein coupled receptors family 1 profile domain-containing protein [Caenorhabditis elegans]|uniref:G-protein coupled receptors family 1 profile domain-containing protein n=1 Tax=Caenorhabditis elegans TaxID=6239 RepID=O44573_CAEEL|nr:G-protein coupled receptors family 1 profile domain-containing protein [Caenorhabditis elegans]CCD74366.1 G-protein coupled receptors family 1 profile domain-containing protein [Caenorhabditis elegans]|eukprot:NP_503489.2 Serpentine Receptor, class W [Caenorhabditis elegans]
MSSPFVDYENLEDVQEVVSGIGYHIHRANFILSLISVLVNLAHITILCRKSMRTSATNVILIGLSISDMCIVMTTVYKHLFMIDFENSDCMTSSLRWKIYVDMTVWSIQIHFRRCVSWLGVLMATVRFVIVKKMTTSRFGNWSKPKVGWYMILVVSCISALQTAFYQSRWMVVENRSIPLPVNCALYQKISRRVQFSVMLNDFFNSDDQFVLRSYLTVDAVVTKFIPCVAFSILTVLLLHALQKLKKSGESIGRKTGSTNEDKKDLSTKLIIFMTISFLIIEAPLGVIYLVKACYDRNDAISILSSDFVVYFSMLVTVNSIIHPIFCILMSSQYRDTIRKMLGVTKKTKIASQKNKTSGVSIQGIQMT